MVPAFFQAYTIPQNPGMELVFPIRGTSKQAYKEAIEEATKRMIAGHKADPTSHWFQVLDSDNENAVVGAAHWHIRDQKSNPFLKPAQPIQVNWWPEGETRNFTTKLMEIGPVIRRARQRRPHAHLAACFTNPDYRRQGIGSMLMECGLNKADELGIEWFLEASELGVPLYENFQFVVVDRTDVDMTVPNPSDEWKELEKRFLRWEWDNMWRPIGGKYEEGQKYPWEE